MAEATGRVTYGKVLLGTHDSYITSDIQIDAITYTVTCDYIGVDDKPFYIVSAPQRLAAEKYLLELSDALDLTELSSISVGKRTVLAAPAHIKPKTLTNQFSTFSVDGCYCTGITHEDVGGRYYGFTVTFTQPRIPIGDKAGSAFSFKGILLGNVPTGHVETDVSGSFVTYTVTTAYSGDDSADYVERLADEIGLGTIYKHDIQRGATGNRGVIKSYDVVSGDLEVLDPTTAMGTVIGIFPESIDSTEEAVGVISLTLVFSKAR